MSTFLRFGVALPVCVAAIAASALVDSTQPKPKRMVAANSGVGSCMPTPTHWWPLQRVIKEYVHLITDPADSLNAKIRIAARLPLIDSSLVATVTVDSLCRIAARKYGLYLYEDSLKISEITLLRLGDSAYAVGDIESRPRIEPVFLVLTLTWEWRGGSIAPVNWPEH